MSAKHLINYSTMGKSKLAFMESMTGPPAVGLILQADVKPKGAQTDILDNSCGGGILTSFIYEVLGKETASSIDIVCGDLSEAMVASASDAIEENGWNAKALCVDSQAMSFKDSYFDFNLANFGVQLAPEFPTKQMAETFRTLKPNGIAGFTTWNTVGWSRYTPGLFVPQTVPEDLSTVDTSLANLGFVDIKRSIHPYEARFPGRNIVAEQMKGTMAGRMTAEIMAAMEKKLEEDFGEGEVFWTSEVLIVTARKPEA